MWPQKFHMLHKFLSYMTSRFSEELEIDYAKFQLKIFNFLDFTTLHKIENTNYTAYNPVKIIDQ